MESPTKTCQLFGSWEELPVELIQVVASRLIVYCDYIRLGAVCVSWRSALPRFPNHNVLRPQLPWLMLPCCSSSSSSSSSLKDEEEDDHSKLSFFDVMENKFHQLNLPAECNGNRVCGSGASSLGWLLMMGENEGPKVVNLYNPLTRILIPLPPFTTLPPPFIELIFFKEEQEEDFAIYVSPSEQQNWSLRDVHKFFIAKMVLTASPSDEEDDYMVVAVLCFGGLAYMKKGDKAWSFYFNYDFPIQDIVFHKGRFYVLSSYFSWVGVLDDFNSNGGTNNIDSSPKLTITPYGAYSNGGTNGTPPKLTVTPYGANNSVKHGHKQYLVEDSSSGSLLLVTRHIHFVKSGHQVTRSFSLYKLEQEDDQNQWVCNQVSSIGGDTLFLGPYSAVCLSVEEGLIRSECRRNCIYFSDTPDTWYAKPSTSTVHDIGVFDLEDGSIKPLLLHEQHPKVCSNHQMPTWVTPNPSSN